MIQFVYGVDDFYVDTWTTAEWLEIGRYHYPKWIPPTPRLKPLTLRNWMAL